MKILVQIDQAAAIKSGIDAPTSAAPVEFDPSALNQQQRELLSLFVTDNGYTTNDSAPFGRVRVGPIKLVEATQAALIDRLNYLLLDADRREKEAVESDKNHASEVEQKMRELLKSPPEKEFVARLIKGEFCHELNERGQSGTPEVSSRSGKLQYLPAIGIHSQAKSYVDQALIAEYNNARALYSEQATSVLDEMEPSLREILAEKKRVEQAEKDDYDKLYARLPATLRKRDAERLASGSEITNAVKQLICSDAGLVYNNSEYRYQTAKTVTDDEFERYESIPVPAGWEKTLELAIDDDGDVEINKRPVAVFTTTRAGIAVETFVEL